MKRMPACWHLSANFGDCITQEVSAALAYQACLVPWGDNRVRAVIGGSILNHAGFGCIAGGVGIANRTDPVNPAVDIRWVRGPVTEERAIECGCKIRVPGLYGDTALCLPLIFSPRKIAPFEKPLLIPHYADMLDLPVGVLEQTNYLSPLSNILAMPEMIVSHSVVITSSLHGMILAHAWGKPVVWIRSERVLGDGTKFADHLHSVHLEHEQMAATWEEAADPGRLAELVAGAQEHSPMVTRQHQMDILEQLEILLADVHAQKQDHQFIPAPITIEPKAVPMKILMKIPTRRPKKALEVIQGYHALASGKHEVKWLVSIDDDDAPTQAMREKFKEIGCEVRSGRSISKIHAGNRDVGEFADWFEIVVLTADDMICKEQDWDDIIAADMKKHFPNLDGVLHYNDGHRGQGLNTLPIMGMACWMSCGYFYHEAFISLFADDEFTRTHQSVYIDRVIIDHQHPVWTGERPDDLLKFTESLAGIDRRTYERRKKAGFPQQIPDLTIGICTVPGREVRLEALMSILREQVKDAGPGVVEIIIEHDDGSEHTGTKRQKILDKANGRFVSFIDDDDLVSIHYVSRILASIEANPYQDAIGFTGRMTTNGADLRTFIHELTGNPEWRTEGLVYYRTPGHLNPVRIDLARRVGYKAMTYGEDMRFCKELFPLLKVSDMLWGDPMYFYLYEPKNSEASKRKNKPTPDGHGAAATVTPEPKQELRARPRKAGIRM